MKLTTSMVRMMTLSCSINLRSLRSSKLQKPREILLPFLLKSKNFEAPEISFRKYFEEKSRSCNKPWRTCGNFKLPRSARSTRVPKNLARYKSYNCPRLLVTCGRSLRWNNTGILFGNSPRTTRVSKDPAQHESCNSPGPLMSQVEKN